MALADVMFEPADNVQSAALDARGRMSVVRVDRARPLTVRGAGLCPVTVPAGAQSTAVALRPVLDLGGDRTGIGFDARFNVRVRHNCPELGAGAISWRQLEGPPLRELSTSADGVELDARMPSFAAVHPEPMPRGVVPISPRTQGRVVLEATWRGPGDRQLAVRTLALTAAARSTGLTSVAVSQPVLIAGSDWHVERRPPGGKATVQARAGHSVFTADMPGSWTLRHSEPGRAPTTLQLSSLTHEATPYDCARSECHAELSALAATTPMSHALERQLTGQTDSAAVSCMLDCHVLGERGLSDGGFHAVAARNGFTWTEATRWHDLPQALRRLGGVRCTGCHGPGAIPPPEQRNAILRSDVCATCHDAPPRYVHVTEWRSSAMSRSGRDAETRSPPCARCHTTAGFLAHNGARKPQADRAVVSFGPMSGASHEASGGAAVSSTPREPAPASGPSGASHEAVSGGAAINGTPREPTPASGPSGASHEAIGGAAISSTPREPAPASGPSGASHEAVSGAAVSGTPREPTPGSGPSSSTHSAQQPAAGRGVLRETAGVQHESAAGVARETAAAPGEAPRRAAADVGGGRRTDAAVSGTPRAAAVEPARAGSGPSDAAESDGHGEVVGIACAACHAPHSGGRGERLVRGVTGVHAGAALEEPRDRLCQACHAPGPELASTAAAVPSGTLWAREVLVPAASGDGWERLHTPFAHAHVEKGCIGCHGGGALAQGHVNHSFRAEPRVCGTCHVDDAMQAGSQAARSLRLQALELGRELARFCNAPQQPRSPHPQLDPARCASAALERAQYEVSLVLEDDAAVFHNAELARALLLDAELQLRNR